MVALLRRGIAPAAFWRISRARRWRRGQAQRTMNQALLAEYFPILVFLGIAAGISVAMVGGALIAARQKPNPEKLSAYECGFEPFDDTRRRFDVRFYLVAILFIIFDLEVAFLFPWAITLGEIGWFGFLSMMGFLGILTVGFVYEWRKGALDWE
jgi:NADH-quinone oxidoreductase subunit A